MSNKDKELNEQANKAMQAMAEACKQAAVGYKVLSESLAKSKALHQLLKESPSVRNALSNEQ